jgi:hypothetical protein
VSTVEAALAILMQLTCNADSVQDRFVPVSEDVLDGLVGDEDGQMGSEFVCEIRCAYKDRDDRVISHTCVPNPRQVMLPLPPALTARTNRLHIGADVDGASYDQHYHREQKENDRWTRYVRQAIDLEPRMDAVDDDRFTMYDEALGLVYMPSVEQDRLDEPSMRKFMQRMFGEWYSSASPAMPST